LEEPETSGDQWVEVTINKTKMKSNLIHIPKDIPHYVFLGSVGMVVFCMNGATLKNLVTRVGI
jgi:hypothetical protein